MHTGLNFSLQESHPPSCTYMCPCFAGKRVGASLHSQRCFQNDWVDVRWAKACSFFLRKCFTEEVDARSFLIKSRHGEDEPSLERD